MVKKSDLFFEIYSTYILRRTYAFLGVILLLSVISFYFTTQLKLKSDPAELLPDKLRSVKDSKRITERVGGIGTIIVAIENRNIKETKRFVEDLVTELKKYPPEYIRNIMYNINESKTFFEKNKLLYVDLDDLKTIHQRILDKIEDAKAKANPFFFEIENEKPVKFDISDLKQKYKSKISAYDKYIDGYFTGENGNLFAVVIRPASSSINVDFVRKFIDKIQATIDSLQPTKYHASIKATITGTYRNTLLEYNSLRNDLLSTSGLCLFLVALVIYLYYWRIRMAFLLIVTIVVGISWTFAITYFHIGYLTTQTAFLSAIIIGNGINYHLIFMARYLEERRKQQGFEQSLITAIKTTWLATLTASLAMSGSYGVLYLANNRGFNQFGFVGSVGMLLCWLSAYTLLPCLLVLSEKIFPVISSKQKEATRPFFSERLAFLIIKFPRGIVLISFVLFLISSLFIAKFLPDYLDYDLSKIRQKKSRFFVSEEYKKIKEMFGRVKSIFDTHQSPAVILADDISEVQNICKSVMAKKNANLSGKRTIDTCKSIYSFLPDEQNEKIKVINDINTLLNGDLLKTLPDDQRIEIEKVRKDLPKKILGISDLPEQIARNFDEIDGIRGRIVWVYPRKEVNMWDYENLLSYAETLRETVLDSGKKIYSASEHVIYVDMLHSIKIDGPRVTIASLVAIFLIIIIVFKRLTPALLILSSVLLGMVWMTGIMAIFRIKFNFFNFIAMPTTFGIAVDYAVNVYQRCQEVGITNIKTAIVKTCGAVVLCSITSTIGYFTLVIAENGALVSYGTVSLIGENSALVSAVLFLPAFILFAKWLREKFVS